MAPIFYNNEETGRISSCFHASYPSGYRTPYAGFMGDRDTRSRPQGFLRFNPTSKMTADDLEELRLGCQVPYCIELRLPGSEERIDWIVPGWEPFYEFMFDTGFRFPILGLLKQFCEFLEIHPSQLMSNTLRTVMGVDRLSELYGFDCVAKDLFQTFSVKEQSDRDPGCYLLFLKSGCTPLIGEQPTNDHK